MHTVYVYCTVFTQWSSIAALIVVLETLSVRGGPLLVHHLLCRAKKWNPEHCNNFVCFCLLLPRSLESLGTGCCRSIEQYACSDIIWGAGWCWQDNIAPPLVVRRRRLQSHRRNERSIGGAPAGSGSIQQFFLGRNSFGAAALWWTLNTDGANKMPKKPIKEKNIKRWKSLCDDEHRPVGPINLYGGLSIKGGANLGNKERWCRNKTETQGGGGHDIFPTKTDVHIYMGFVLCPVFGFNWFVLKDLQTMSYIPEKNQCGIHIVYIGIQSLLHVCLHVRQWLWWKI